MIAPDVLDTTLLVLCGGAGSRMGGRDKPLLAWHGETMVDRVLRSVPETWPRIISANRNLDVYGARAPVVTDADTGLGPNGPLVGVLAGLLNMHTGWLLVAPGDTPALPMSWWQVMFSAASGEPAVVAHDGTRQQHLHLLLHRSVTDRLQAYLRRGRHEVHLWLDELHPAVARFDDAEAFANINRAEDLPGG